jgi:hypothetical protein
MPKPPHKPMTILCCGKLAQNSSASFSTEVRAVIFMGMTKHNTVRFYFASSQFFSLMGRLLLLIAQFGVSSVNREYQKCQLTEGSIF